MRSWGTGTFSTGQLTLIVDAATPWYFERLPESYYENGTLANLAPDAQLYFACPACSRHWRVNPSLTGAEFACPCRPDAPLTSLRCRPRLTYLCLHCGQEFVNFVNRWDRPGRCPRCLARQTIVTGAKPLEPRPDAFFSVSLDPVRSRPHRWGADLNADLRELDSEQALVLDLPGSERHLVPFALFAARLAEMASGTDEMWFKNVEAGALQESYKMTTDITSGWTALRLYWESARAAAGTPQAEARFTHNVALACFSLLAIGSVLVIAATEDGDLLRDIGLSAGERARDLYRQGAGTPEDRAMISYALGSLCATSADPALLSEAVEHFDTMLAAPALPPGAREGTEAKRMRALAELAVRREGGPS
jgi:DNA-directed RNA polymerase subunit RPC12/RpoP